MPDEVRISINKLRNDLTNEWEGSRLALIDSSGCRWERIRYQNKVHLANQIG
jgi:hypothetical protein